MPSLGTNYTISLQTKDREKIAPNPERTKHAIARIGYSLEESVADLIDNSVDAKASTVLLRLLRDGERVKRVFIVDDGVGMDSETLHQAMRFGSSLEHKKSDIGKYGYGLKSASLSHCDEFSVITRKNGKTSGRRWSSSSFKKDWVSEILEPKDCALLMSEGWAGMDLKKHGTIIVWDNVSSLQAVDARVDEIVNRAIKSLTSHLGLVFHRFIDSEILRILIDTQFVDHSETPTAAEVEALDPFSYPISGDPEYPKTFRLRVEDVSEIVLKAHIWPPKSRAPGYRLGGGQVSSRQGFYFYWNDRLIQAGGWNGFRADDSEPHFSLARVAVDLPVESAGAFDVTVQKSKVSVPPSFIKSLASCRTDGVLFSDYVARAGAVYRQKDRRETDYPLVPGKGLKSSARKFAKEEIGSGERRTREVAFVWKGLNAGLVFELDRKNRTILLNEMYRKALLKGERKSQADATPLKMMIFLLVRDYFDFQQITKNRQDFLDQTNALLLRCIND